jgi:hypothetical protein
MARSGLRPAIISVISVLGASGLAINEARAAVPYSPNIAEDPLALDTLIIHPSCVSLMLFALVPRLWASPRGGAQAIN